MTVSPSTLGEVLEGHGVKQSWLAEQLGVSRTSMSRWAKGDEPVPEARRQRIAELLRVSEAELFGMGSTTNGRGK